MRYIAQFGAIGHLTVGPTTNVCGRVAVGVKSKFALQTGKLVLGLSVPLRGMLASRALASQRSLVDLDAARLETR
jgi:hypothetical protein